jgi:phosphoglycerate dehydrogenase-like enzyme
MMKIAILVDRLAEEDRDLIIEKLSDDCEIFFKEDIKNGDLDLEDIDVAIVSAGRREETRMYLKKMKNLKFLQTLSAGVDHLPFRDIPIKTVIASNSGANSEEVAEYAVSLLLTAVKNIHLNDRSLRKQVWNVHIPRLIKGSRVLIWGYGSIGREIAKRLKPFKCMIYGVNRSGKADEYVEYVYTPDEIGNILPKMNYIILALPLTKETRGIVNKNILSLMRKDAVLVNIGRGGLIVEEDLYSHLVENPEFTAAIDVWWRYPKKRGEKYEFKYPFYKLSNIIMTPHVAGYWKKFRRKLLQHALENVLRFLRGGKPLNIVDRKLYL